MPIVGLERLAHDVKPKGNQCLLDLIELIAHRRYSLCPLIRRPLDMLFDQLTADSKRLHRINHRLLGITLNISRTLSPVIDGSTQIHQVPIKV